MIEITNITRSPIPLVVKSRLAPRSFTNLIIPGKGAGHNVRIIADEKHTEYIDRAESQGLIKTRYIPNKEL